MAKFLHKLMLFTIVSTMISACGSSPAKQDISNTATQDSKDYQVELKVLAVQSFLADIAQNIAGNRLKVDTLLPLEIDPHAFEPTTKDLARVNESQVLIVNGAGLEEWLQEVLDNAGGNRLVIEASTGLASSENTDPHFWLDPLNVITYVENIRAGLSEADPGGSQIYQENADSYISQLKDLDTWIQMQVAKIPPERRQLVTNHESFGYFADRYGFTIVGTILSSSSASASPSAQELGALIDQIRSSGAGVIFLETGTNPQLANQLSQETGIKVITDLYSHSLTAADGSAPDYISMMRHNVQTIVEALR